VKACNVVIALITLKQHSFIVQTRIWNQQTFLHLKKQLCLLYRLPWCQVFDQLSQKRNIIADRRVQMKKHGMLIMRLIVSSLRK